MTLDSAAYEGMRVHLPSGVILLHFQERGSCLFYYDTTIRNNETSSNVSAYLFLSTVDNNLKRFTFYQSKQKGIVTAERVYRTIGSPSHEAFLRMVTHRQIANCPITFG